MIQEAADLPEDEGPWTSKNNPEILRLDELNTPAWDGEPWLDPDGLTIYWASGSEVGARIWTASRKSPESLFEGKKLICKGQCPTVTGDGKQLFFIDRRTDGEKGLAIHVARRASTDADFDRPREVAEFRPSSPLQPVDLARWPDAHLPGRRRGTPRIIESKRRSPDSDWETPHPLPISVPVDLDGDLEYPCLTPDRLTLYCCLDRVRDGKQTSRLMVWTRDIEDRPFARFGFLTLPGAPGSNNAINLCPRYIRRTNELFLCSYSPSQKGYVDLWLVENFKPIATGESDRGPFYNSVRPLRLHRAGLPSSSRRRWPERRLPRWSASPS